MAKKSKFFRVAVEGGTTDGRVIERAWIDDMVQNFNRETYGPRCNIEHIRGFSADPPFNAYGDVVGVKAEDIQLAIGGKTEKRRALYAQVDALPNLVTLSEKSQKIYPSIEVSPNFGGSGKAGLVGLAFTDSPASLGTEILAFAASQGDKNPFAGRKADPANLIAACDEGLKLEFEADAPAPTPSPEYAGFFSAATDFFKRFTGPTPAPSPTPTPTPPPAANDNAALLEGFGKLTEGMTAMAAKVSTDLAAITAKVTSVETELSTVKASVENTDAGGRKRAPATGGQNFAQTDF